MASEHLPPDPDRHHLGAVFAYVFVNALHPKSFGGVGFFGFLTRVLPQPCQ